MFHKSVETMSKVISMNAQGNPPALPEDATSLAVPRVLGLMGMSRGLFPLTPALSPEERGNSSPSVGESSVTSWQMTRSRVLHLLWGEGRVRGNGGQEAQDA